MASSGRLQQDVFPVSWTELHRDARALAWRLADLGPFQGAGGDPRAAGWSPAAIIARELNLRLIDTVCCSNLRPHGARGAKVELLKGSIAEQDKGKGLADRRRPGRYRRYLTYFARCRARRCCRRRISPPSMPRPAGRPHRRQATSPEVSQDHLESCFPWDQEAVMAQDGHRNEGRQVMAGVAVDNASAGA